MKVTTFAQPSHFLGLLESSGVMDVETAYDVYDVYKLVVIPSSSPASSHDQ